MDDGVQGGSWLPQTSVPQAAEPYDQPFAGHQVPPANIHVLSSPNCSWGSLICLVSTSSRTQPLSAGPIPIFSNDRRDSSSHGPISYTRTAATERNWERQSCVFVSPCLGLLVWNAWSAAPGNVEHSPLSFPLFSSPATVLRVVIRLAFL